MVYVYNTTRTRIDIDYYKFVAKHALQEGKCVNDANITVIFVGKKRIRGLNRKYRGKDSVTDVLSFLYEAVPLEGDIYICIPCAREQSVKFGHSLKAELSQLIIHGVLHLLGYEHEEEEDAERMRNIEDRTWRTFRRKRKV